MHEVALRYHQSFRTQPKNWCASMLTRPVAMLCRVRSGEKCGRVACRADTLYEREHSDQAGVGIRGGYAGVPKLYAFRFMPCAHNGSV